jgi:hypothetical protein
MASSSLEQGEDHIGDGCANDEGKEPIQAGLESVDVAAEGAELFGDGDLKGVGWLEVEGFRWGRAEFVEHVF